jgi:hypothetical protein
MEFRGKDPKGFRITWACSVLVIVNCDLSDQRGSGDPGNGAVDKVF